MGHTVERTRWIGLADGTRLAATIWWPEGAGPWPAVLEYLPYRRGDQTAARDDSTYPHYAKAGIVGVRVDSRGNGDSDGFMDDEYSPTELSDASEVIAWIAGQDWSNGAVGMMGISWGGFNALQLAALRPPALKAVISIASTADRYNDDIHYKGGALLSANVYWAGQMLSFSSRPPEPEVVGNGWAEMWRRRLEDQPMHLETWLTHQHRDAYWKHGSICEDWSAIQCPVFVIAGWADGYRNAPAEILANLEAPCWAMTGPWIHKYPHFAYPHPRADFIGLSVDWWHQWLSGESRGVQMWPKHRAYRLEALRPAPWREEDPGRWVDAGQTSPQTRLFLLGANGVLGGREDGSAIVATPEHCGTTGGEFFTSAPDAYLPTDQRMDDGLSVCWETEAMEATLDLSGRAMLKAKVAIDQPQGNLIARLMDVHPDGTSMLISRGVLNLCHRNGQEAPEPMVPGEAFPVELQLDECCYRIREGHRLRLAVSTAYWPIVLPGPAPVTAVLTAGTLGVPVTTALPEIDVPAPADPDPMPSYAMIEAGEGRRWVEHDIQAGLVRYHIEEDTGLQQNPHSGLQFQDTRHEVWETDPLDPAACRGEMVFRTVRRRGAWLAETQARVEFTMTETNYDVRAELVARSGDEEICRRDWAFSVPRQLV
ncbi:MAG: CocE/NonD family hydrolase [Pseudomonadota bacterium]